MEDRPMTCLEFRQIYAGPDELARGAADLILRTMRAKSGPVGICLSGGATPQRLYELLATAEFRAALPWDRIHWFWGDERYVAPDHPQSNFGAAQRALFAHVPANIHPVPTHLPSPLAAAEAYEATLREWHVDPARPLFDITLLGLGEDGHTASLFPGHVALDEQDRWVVPVLGARPEPRITLTFPALNATEEVVFLVAGTGKRQMVQRIAAGEDLPAARVTARGRVLWMLDQDAVHEEGERHGCD